MQREGASWGTTPLLLELSPIYPLFIPKSFTDTPLYPQLRPTKNAVKRHVSSHCLPRGALMPFGTSTKERLCTEMNNYPQNANIRHHFLVICKRIHKLRRGWTTSVDNPVDVWIICGHTRFFKAKSAKNTVDNPVETVDAFAQFKTI